MRKKRKRERSLLLAAVKKLILSFRKVLLSSSRCDNTELEFLRGFRYIDGITRGGNGRRY